MARRAAQGRRGNRQWRRTATYFQFLNANNANLAMRDQTYRQGLSRCEVLPDGVGVDIASRTLHGSAFPANLNGTDFIPALLVHIESRSRSL
jgi:UDP-N-acetyl-D-mannosaminuronic acid transferase (WecB/TagA/CpsF family)